MTRIPLTLGKHFLLIDSPISFYLVDNEENSVYRPSGVWQLDTWKLLPEKYQKDHPVYTLSIEYDESKLADGKEVVIRESDIDLGDGVAGVSGQAVMLTGINDSLLPISVSVSNIPDIQKVTVQNQPTEIAVNNLPANQKVNVSNFPDIQKVTVQNQPTAIAVNNLPANQKVNVSNFPDIQNVNVQNPLEERDLGRRIFSTFAAAYNFFSSHQRFKFFTFAPEFTQSSGTFYFCTNVTVYSGHIYTWGYKSTNGREFDLTKLCNYNITDSSNFPEITVYVAH